MRHGYVKGYDMTQRRKTRLHKDYEKFLEWKEKRVSPTTLISVRRTLRSFPPDPKDLTAEHFERRLGAETKMKGVPVRRVSHATVRLELAYAKQFYDFMGWDKSELQRFRLPRIPKSTVTIEDLYTKEELDRIRAVLDNPRDRAMIDVLYLSLIHI